MSFIEKVVGPDEELIGVATIHWIYGLQGLMWLFGFGAAGALINQGVDDFFFSFSTNPGMQAIDTMSDVVFWICAVVGVIIFFFYIITMISTEVGLTTKRVIYKKGLIMVDVKEVDIEEIKGADVDNGFFGRFLNYGYILLDARFIKNVNIPAIAAPYRFMKALNEMCSREHYDSLRPVLEGVDERFLLGGAEKELERSGELYRLKSGRYKSFGSSPFREAGEILKEAGDVLHGYTEREEAPEPPEKTRKQETEREGKATRQKPVVFKEGILKQAMKHDFFKSRK